MEKAKHLHIKAAVISLLTCCCCQTAFGDDMSAADYYPLTLTFDTTTFENGITVFSSDDSPISIRDYSSLSIDCYDYLSLNYEFYLLTDDTTTEAKGGYWDIFGNTFSHTLTLSTISSTLTSATTISKIRFARRDGTTLSPRIKAIYLTDSSGNKTYLAPTTESSNCPYTTFTAAEKTAFNVYTDCYFPLDSSSMNLKIWGTNSFDNDTKTIIYTGQYVNAGWFWGTANLSDYQYLVVTLNPKSNIYVGTRLYQGDSTYSQTDSSSQEISQIKDGTAYTSFDLIEGYWKPEKSNAVQITFSAAAQLGFWVYGAESGTVSLPLANVFLTNTLPDWNNPVTKTKSKDNWGTVCLEYPATAVGAYIYTVTGKSSDNTTITVTPYNGMLQAGVPYLFKSTNDSVCFYEIKAEALKVATAASNGGLIGVYNDSVISSDSNTYYVLHDNVWYKATSNVQVTNGAYLNLDSVDSESSESARGVTMKLVGGETTGISSVGSRRLTEDSNAAYNLTGQRVNDSYKGLTVRNGKKIINK